jgi:hypothetical protein
VPHPVERDSRLLQRDTIRHHRTVTPDQLPTEQRLRELAFLQKIAQLATLARDWDELMRSIVDGTTEALGVEVCSFYLADRASTRLTLAASGSARALPGGLRRPASRSRSTM